MNSHLKSNIKFRIYSRGFSGNFILSFEPEVIYEIENEIDCFVSLRTRAAILLLGKPLSIQKIQDGYMITPKSFVAVCNIIFRVIKKYS